MILGIFGKIYFRNFRFSKFPQKKSFQKIFSIRFFDEMKKYFSSRFFSTIWIISLDFRKHIQSTRQCSSMIRRWTRFRDCLLKWEEISGFSRQILFLSIFCMDFQEFSHYFRLLCRVWVNWSHGSQGRMKNMFYFSTSLYIVIIRKKCLGPVAIVSATEKQYGLFSWQIFPRAPQHLPGERDLLLDSSGLSKPP